MYSTHARQCTASYSAQVVRLLCKTIMAYGAAAQMYGKDVLSYDLNCKIF